MKRTWLGMLIIAAVSLMMTLVASSCGGVSEQKEAPSGNAMYYWKTVFRLDSAERQYLQRHDVKTLYVRFFDVVVDRGENKPNATISFADSMPAAAECVPVVFILNDCMKKPMQGMPELIVRRVFQMCETNDIPSPKEIQIDCDWTGSTRENFFRFMRQLQEELNERDVRLSVTIRLHQLDQEAPPADYGVLMVYNTGDYSRPGRNPILDPKDVEPYLRYLINYDLPLSAAYPIFTWKILYGPVSHGSKDMAAKGFIYDVNPDSEPELFRKTAPDRWLVTGTRNLQSAAGDASNIIRATPGMELILYSPPPFRTLVNIEKAVAAKRPGINSRVVLYDLDSKDLNLYTPQQYDTIFNP